jgi:Mg2+ and Co2+ transporter CorA
MAKEKPNPPGSDNPSGPPSKIDPALDFARKSLENQVALSTAIREISGHSREEIKWVQSAYKWLASTLGGSLAIVLAAGIYFSYNSAHEFKADLMRESTNEINSFKLQLMEETRTLVESNRLVLISRINEEFESSNIVALVREQAKVRIDEIADTLIKRDITNQISPILTSLRDQVGTALQQASDRLMRANDMENGSHNFYESMNQLTLKLEGRLSNADNLLSNLNSAYQTFVKTNEYYKPVTPPTNSAH